MMFARSVVLACTLALLISVACAQEQGAEKGVVSGVVKDVKGELAPGVEVRLLNPTTRPQRRATTSPSEDKQARKDARPKPAGSAMTDEEGKFELKDLPPGKYVIQARVKDVGAARQEIEVVAGKATSVDLQLRERKSDRKPEKRAAQ